MVYQSIADNFCKELAEAKSGKKTSFPFIVHEIPSVSLVGEDEIFQVLVIGGSIFLNALLKKRRGKLIVLKRESKGQKTFHTKEDFLSLIEHEIDPSVRVVAINFAYPLKPVFEKGRLDGILIMGSKENMFRGLIGKKICEEVEKHIKKKKGKTITASIANDTVCFLLSGLTEVTSHDIAAGIVGTGLNFALFLDAKHPVNLEAAWFDKFDQTEEGKDIDRKSAAPKNALFEKETAGAYLYKHFNLLLKKHHIDFPPLQSTKELDPLFDDPTSDVYPIAKMVLERSAGFIAAAIAGITLFKKKDMTFVMEGSLFWNAKFYKRNVKKLVLKIVPEYTITFIKIEDSPIYGGAKLVA